MHKSTYKIRSLFLDPVTSIPSSISYWNNLFDDIKCSYVWSLPQKFFLTNKVKDISYKIIQRLYPVKYFLKKFRNDIDTSCSFCEASSETIDHLFWKCLFTLSFWNIIDVLIVQKLFFFCNFFCLLII